MATYTTAAALLQLVRNEIQARVTGESVESYQIEGRSLSNTPISDLIRLEKYYDKKAKAEATVVGGLDLVTFEDP